MDGGLNRGRKASFCTCELNISVGSIFQSSGYSIHGRQPFFNSNQRKIIFLENLPKINYFRKKDKSKGWRLGRKNVIRHIKKILGRIWFTYLINIPLIITDQLRNLCPIWHDHKYLFSAKGFSRLCHISCILARRRYGSGL